MLQDKDYIDWLKSTRELINKYNLKQISITIKHMKPFDKKTMKIVDKDMVHIKIKDIHDIVMDDTTYDILDKVD